jgi:hypothetical protein
LGGPFTSSRRGRLANADQGSAQVALDVDREGLALVALLILWSASTPGWDMLRLVIAGWISAGLLVWWMARLVAHVAVRGTRRRRFLVGPIAGLVLLMLLFTHAPLQARWALSEDGFEAALANLPPEPAVGDAQPMTAPPRIGRFSIT